MLCVAWCAGLAHAGPAALEVLDASGAVTMRFPIVAGQRWCLLWNHSVAGFTVRDCFAWRPPQLVLIDSHQPDFAAGLGHVAGRGVQRSDGMGGYLIENIDQPIDGNRLRLRVGSRRVDHRIELGDTLHSLSAVHAGRSVELRVVVPDGHASVESAR
jgi:hypothetical protein